MKRRRCELERARRGEGLQGLLSDGQTDDTTATTDQSASPGYSDCEGTGTTTDRILDSSDEDFLHSEVRSGQSSDSLAGLTDCSAESIALSLLSRVGHGRLPPADKVRGYRRPYSLY